MCVLYAIGSGPSPGDPIPQCSVLNSPAQLLHIHAYGFFYGIIHLILGLYLFLMPFIFPTLLSSPRTLLPHDVLKVRQLCHFFASRDVSTLICSKTHLSVFLVDQGIHKTLLQHHLPSESNFFYHPFILAQLSHPQIVIGNLGMWMILSLIFNETYLLLKIFPNSSIVVFLSLNLPVIFCFQA